MISFRQHRLFILDKKGKETRLLRVSSLKLLFGFDFDKQIVRLDLVAFFNK